MPLCSKKKVFIYEIDKKKDFFKEVIRHEDKLQCQNLYFMHYKKVCPQLLDEQSEHYNEI